MEQYRSLGGAVVAGGSLLAAWSGLYFYGRHFARRDKLQLADAIVSVAGSLGNRNFLDGKVDTSVRLYQEGWAPLIVFSGRWSHRVSGVESRLIGQEEVDAAVAAGRIDAKTAEPATQTWDLGLDAEYMRQRAIQAGVPSAAILTECESLHTLENAQFSAPLLVECGARAVVLVAAPFHQLRAYYTFVKVYEQYGITVRGYAADTHGWNPLTWFLSAENRRLICGEARRIRAYGLA